jgi:hypothetical protein
MTSSRRVEHRRPWEPLRVRLNDLLLTWNKEAEARDNMIYDEANFLRRSTSPAPGSRGGLSTLWAQSCKFSGRA